MIKKIILDIPFPDDFSPPDKFEEALSKNGYRTPCKDCPFFGWDDETADSWCEVLYGKGNKCPIKKFF